MLLTYRGRGSVYSGCGEIREGERSEWEKEMEKSQDS